MKWTNTKDIKDLRYFLGLATYYMKLIYQFSHLAEPLHKLTRKDTKFPWTSKEEVSFKKLKNELASTPVLSIIDLWKTFLVEEDA